MVGLDTLVVPEEVGGHAVLALGRAEELAAIGNSIRDFVARIAALVQVVALFASVALVLVLFESFTLLYWSDRPALEEILFNVQLVEHLRLASFARVPIRVQGSAVFGRVGDAVSVQVEVVILTNQANIGNRGQLGAVGDIVGITLLLEVVEVLPASHALVEQGVVDLAVGHGVGETETGTIIMFIHTSLAVVRIL